MDIELGVQDGGSRMKNILLFKDVSYSLPLSFGGRLRALLSKCPPLDSCIAPGNPPKEILAGVGGALRPGRLTCMLGSSGAGKTTLLHILAERKKLGVKGELVGTGRSVILVPQEVFLMGTLTARETLSLAAELKLPASTKAQRDDTILKVATILGIENALDKRASKMSGSERKRLTIAQELIGDPPVLLLDEPTSGLDSVSSVGVILALQKVARTGCVVACSLQQPSTRLFSLCDDVLLLSHGRTLYAGPREGLLGALEAAELVCPQYYNPADYLLEIAHGDHLGHLNALEDVSQKYVEGHFDDWQHGRQRSSTEIAMVGKSHIKDTEKSAEDNTRLLHHPHTTIKPPPRASTSSQMWTLLRRTLYCGLRDTQLALVRVIAHILVSLLLGFLFAGSGNEAWRMQTNASCLFFFLVFVFFANSMPTIRPFSLEASVVLQEHLNHWYSVTAYFFSKLAAELPLQILCPTLFLLPAWYMTDQPYEPMRVGLMWLLCFLMTFIAQSAGQLAGAAFDIKVALFVVPAANILMLLFSGYFININEIPESLQFVSNISYFRYAFDGAMQTSYGFGRPTMKCNIAYCPFTKSQMFLDELGIGQSFYYDVNVLLSWVLVLQVTLYLVLILRVKLLCK